jgi:hypothetical protein
MTATPDETEETLRSLGCKYTREADGSFTVHGDLRMNYQGLTELPDLSSVTVTGNFVCDDNRLTSLMGCPREVGGDFWCHHNSLTSLEGGPQKVGGNYWCHDNNLTSVAHAPDAIGGYFYCDRNPLENLEGAPHSFIQITSDFGNFKSWDEVPAHLRFSAGTRNKMAEEAASRETLERLHKAANDRPPIRLKKAGPK